MSTGTVIIVWAVNCWAFIRFYHWWVWLVGHYGRLLSRYFDYWWWDIPISIYKHRKVLEREEIPLVRRWDRDNYRDYPYRSHGQPALAYLALAGCIFMLVVSEGSMLWKEFDAPPFLSAYLQVRIITLFPSCSLLAFPTWGWYYYGYSSNRFEYEAFYLWRLVGRAQGLSAG